jgi:tetratricopeptide (TPR) repeat protein
MRRIAILLIGLLAAVSAFGQAKGKKGATAATGAAGATGGTGAVAAAPEITGPHPRSNAERDAVIAMSTAKDPDGQIKAAEDLLTNFPNTDYKAQALQFEAEAYHSKRDDTKALAMGEKALDADPKGFETLLLMAEILSQSARPTDLDMNDKLTKSDKYANDAIEYIAAADKPNASVTDAQWAGAKKDETARGWASLGFSALVRGKFDDAKTDFQKSADMSPNAVVMLYIDRAYITAKRYDDAIAWTDKAIAAAPGNDQIAKYAAGDKTRAQAMKKQAGQ